MKQWKNRRGFVLKDLKLLWNDSLEQHSWFPYWILRPSISTWTSSTAKFKNSKLSHWCYEIQRLAWICGIILQITELLTNALSSRIQTISAIERKTVSFEWPQIVFFVVFFPAEKINEEFQVGYSSFAFPKRNLWKQGKSHRTAVKRKKIVSFVWLMVWVLFWDMIHENYVFSSAMWDLNWMPPLTGKGTPVSGYMGQVTSEFSSRVVTLFKTLKLFI